MRNDALFAHALSDSPSLVERLTNEFNEALRDFNRDPRAFIASAIRKDGAGNRRRSTLLKFGLAVGVVFYALVFASMLIFWVAGHSNGHEVANEKGPHWIVFPPGKPNVERPKADEESGGGGGGGDRSLTLPSRGRPPDFSNDPLMIAPTTKPQSIAPLLPVSERILVDPRFQVTRDENLPTGLPDGIIGPPSDGPGNNRGIGTGSNGGAGSGNGPGFGPGDGGNTGGGHRKDGGGRGGPEAAVSVDSKPVPLNRPRPNYTEEARVNKISGTARVRVLVGADGTVKDVRIQVGLPGGLNEEAIRAARQMRFRPATKDGRAVAYWVPVDIEFNLR
jgi:TonB family protein